MPIRDYEELKPYVEHIKSGESNVLWPGKPIYFAKTSGTTSGVKYIPITKPSIKHQVNASRNAILNYILETGNSSFVDGRMIFLQGSPVLETKHGIKTGRLSGISAHYVPSYLQRNRLPSWETNCIEDWETKVDKIVEETENENMTVIAGIPSWVQMYFEKLNQKTGKKVGELFKNFQLFIYGGVNYEPYRAKFESLIGRRVDSIELFPASEGFFAYQDSQTEKGMLLLLNSGIFYEFVKAEDFFNEGAERITIKDVQLGVNYAMVISTDAGLWGYNLGDTVEFVSLNPYRVIVSGRNKTFHFCIRRTCYCQRSRRGNENCDRRNQCKSERIFSSPSNQPRRGVAVPRMACRIRGVTFRYGKIYQFTGEINEAPEQLLPRFD